MRMALWLIDCNRSTIACLVLCWTGLKAGISATGQEQTAPVVKRPRNGVSALADIEPAHEVKFWFNSANATPRVGPRKYAWPWHGQCRGYRQTGSLVDWFTATRRPVPANDTSLTYNVNWTVWRIERFTAEHDLNILRAHVYPNVARTYRTSVR